jgi:hypothetical protein
MSQTLYDIISNGTNGNRNRSIYDDIGGNRSIYDDIGGNRSIYDDMMQKEDSAIRLMNRTIDDRQKQDERDQSFLHTRLSRMPLLLMKHLNDILNDLLRLSFDDLHPMDIVDIFATGQRPIYMGLLLLFVALFLMLIHISEHS